MQPPLCKTVGDCNGVEARLRDMEQEQRAAAELNVQKKQKAEMLRVSWRL